MLEISVIILATSLEVTKQGEQYSYFFRRALPMKTTWASLFDIELAFGTNVFDNEFLLAHCAGLRRRLRVTAPQTPPRDAVESYECDEGLRVLYFANCTGEYMGLGPVCRCQEAIRYWQSPRFQAYRWFAFMDDDVYLRPWPLVGLLSGFDDAKPAAFVGAHGNRGLALTRDRWKHCGELCAFRFPWAQPAILSRGAIESMRSMTDRSYMTEVQKIWFGTHDVILGLALWWWSIPILSLGNLRIRDLPRTGKHGAPLKRPPGDRRDVGLMLHYVRNEPQPPYNISSAVLFDFLKDGDEQHRQHQIDIGVHARHRLKFFKNDGARSLRSDVAPTNATYIFHPDACVGQTPSDILAKDANRARPDKCVFEDFHLGSSDLRSPNADTPLQHAMHRTRKSETRPSGTQR